MDYLILAYVLIGLGLLLMMADLFIPISGGVLFVLGIGALIVGVVMTFTSGSYETGLVTLVILFVAIPTFSTLVFRVWPRTAMGRRLFLSGPHEDDTLANMPVNLELENLAVVLGEPCRHCGPAAPPSSTVAALTPSAKAA